MAESQLNPPGYYYAIAYWLAAVVFSLLYGPKKSLIRSLVSAVVLFFLVFLMRVTHQATGIRYILVMMIVCFTVMAFYGWRISCSKNEAVFYGVKVFMIGELMASLAWQICSFCQEKVPAGYALLFQIGCMHVVYAAGFSGVFLLEQRVSRQGNAPRVTERDAKISAILGISIFVLSNLTYLNGRAPFSAQVMRDTYIIHTLTDFGGVMLLYAYSFLAINLQNRFEKENLQSIIEMQYQNYRLSRESIDMINRKYHDLKHQIAVLKTEAQSGSAVFSLEKIEEEIRAYEGQNKTGNAVLDTILTSKSIYCQIHGIEFRCMADGRALSFMELMDLSALFGNMLDNAIECEEQIPEKERRMIRLAVFKERCFVRIRIDNYCEQILQFHDGLPVTTKEDAYLHGFGMKSMRITAEKYGGSLTAGQRDNWFELRILIPLPDGQPGEGYETEDS